MPVVKRKKVITVTPTPLRHNPTRNGRDWDNVKP
jgi:hypothetical protein